ncbi:MAG: PAS domain-containing protein [Alphaproteobacteria bacterium]|nr:PAS domain-containing protein [Alphaproteobacteria bacterium]
MAEVMKLPEESLEEAVPERRPGKERRLVLRLLDYWRGITGDRNYPSLNDVRSDDIADMWPFCFVLDVSENADDPLLRYVGEEIIECYGAPCVNLRVSEIRKDSLLDVATSYISEIQRKGVPISYGNSFKSDNGEGVLCRSILLPLSDNNETISLILGGANYLKNPKSK